MAFQTRDEVVKYVRANVVSGKWVQCGTCFCNNYRVEYQGRKYEKRGSATGASEDVLDVTAAKGKARDRAIERLADAIIGDHPLPSEKRPGLQSTGRSPKETDLKVQLISAQLAMATLILGLLIQLEELESGAAPKVHGPDLPDNPLADLIKTLRRAA